VGRHGAHPVDHRRGVAHLRGPLVGTEPDNIHERRGVIGSDHDRGPRTATRRNDGRRQPHAEEQELHLSTQLGRNSAEGE
jgi:hypothetical protein